MLTYDIGFEKLDNNRYKVINGKIPEYYSGSLSKGSNIYSIPIE